MNELFFHHAIELDYAWPRSMPAIRKTALLEAPPCRHDVYRGCSRDCYDSHRAFSDAEHFEPAYEWLADHVGFWPIFMKVGNTLFDQWVTGGYGLQFEKPRAGSPFGAEKRAPMNRVMFSYRSVPDVACFFFEDDWVAVLNDVYRGSVSQEIEAQLFKRQLKRADWMRLAAKFPGAIEVVVPLMPLADAPMVSCRNLATARTLMRRGFEATQVFPRRFPSEPERLEDPAWCQPPVSMAQRARR